MDPRGVAALVSLCLVGAVVIGLVATSGGDAGSDAGSAPVASSAADAPETVVPDPNLPELPDGGPHPEFLPVQEWLPEPERALVR